MIVFHSLWLVKLFTKRKFIHVVQCMQGEYIYLMTVAITFARSSFGSFTHVELLAGTFLLP